MKKYLLHGELIVPFIIGFGLNKGVRYASQAGAYEQAVAASIADYSKVKKIEERIRPVKVYRLTCDFQYLHDLCDFVVAL